MSLSRLTWSMVVSAVVFFLAMAMAGWALNERFRQTDERRKLQAAINIQEQKQSLDHCREIEKLKAAWRNQARLSRRNLPRNLRLLGIPYTPELQRVANANLAVTLERFKREQCPRPIDNGGEG